ncbi:uncharacterized protein LOC141983808 [Natator depressus]|uniref:uncharacterized protein LOC141983808 n=1 Tax=Natator depressus TaxID=27790 RepID=UPI003EB9D257
MPPTRWKSELPQRRQPPFWIKALTLLTVVSTRHSGAFMTINNNDIHAPGYMGQGKSILTALLIHAQANNTPWLPPQETDIHLRWVDLKTNLTLTTLGETHVYIGEGELGLQVNISVAAGRKKHWMVGVRTAGYVGDTTILSDYPSLPYIWEGFIKSGDLVTVIVVYCPSHTHAMTFPDGCEWTWEKEYVFIRNTPVQMAKPALFKTQTTPVKALVSPLLVKVRIDMDWTRLNVSKVEPKCMPFSLPILIAWLKTHKLSPPDTPHPRTKRDIMDTMLGGFGAGAGLANSVDLETIKNKLNSLAQLQDNLIQKQVHANVDLVQIGLGNLKAQWNLWQWLNTTTWLMHKKSLDIGNHTAIAMGCTEMQILALATLEYEMFWVISGNIKVLMHLVKQRKRSLFDTYQYDWMQWTLVTPNRSY